MPPHSWYHHGRHRHRRPVADGAAGNRRTAKATLLAMFALVLVAVPLQPSSGGEGSLAGGHGGPATPPAGTPSSYGGSPTPAEQPAGTGGVGPAPVPTPGAPIVTRSGIDFPEGPVFRRSSVSQHGITWQFDREHTVGHYANGDWWVVGPLTLTGITPESTDQRNGENINPGKGDEGYDGNLGPVQRLSYPVTVEPNSSIVKAVSRTAPPDDSHRGELQTAAVLTVVGEPPPKNGATAFRPPYFGQDKPRYLTTDLRTELLPSLAHPQGMQVASLDRVVGRFARLQLDHNAENERNRRMHPVDNMADYGAQVAVDSHFAALRLMLDDALSDKAQALINYVQYGIDLGAMIRHDAFICADTNQSCAGHGQGRTLPLVFAATMLDAGDMQEAISANSDILPENYSVTRTANAPTPLFGDAVCSEELYEQVRNGGSGPRTCRDPHGYVDGGDEPGSYQVCCMSQPWKGAVTAMHLMPELATTWPESDKLIEYVDRYVSFGLWTRPDPLGRFESAHGTYTDEGHYRVELADALWDEHSLGDRVAIDWTNP